MVKDINIQKKYSVYREYVIKSSDKLDLNGNKKKKKKRFNIICKNNNVDSAAEALGESRQYVYKYLRHLAYEIKKKNKENNVGAHLSQTPAAPQTQDSSETHVASNTQMSQYIPHDDGYISQKMLNTSDVNILQGLYNNRMFALLVGPTGSGKSHIARHIAYKNKSPYMRVNLNGATVPEDLVGQWIPNSNPDIESKYVWQDGTLTMFMRYGGIFVVDEINMAPADILSLFHSITDDERRLVLTNKDGEVVHAHPDFYLIATMNVGYEGTKPLNLALKDRFRIFQIDYNKTTERKLGISNELIDVADSLRNSESIETPVSTRDLLKFEKDIHIFGKMVAREFFINNFYDYEKSAVQEVLSLKLDRK